MDHFGTQSIPSYLYSPDQENPQLLQNLLTIQQQIQDSHTVQYADSNLEPHTKGLTNHYCCFIFSLSGFEVRGKIQYVPSEFSLLRKRLQSACACAIIAISRSYQQR